jgi:A/G-specific adenine glycosylase
MLLTLMDLGSLLKKKIPNPNRRSLQYVRQSAFAGSDRELRGKIIKLLLKRPGLELSELVQVTGEESGRVQNIIGILEQEGFLTSSGDSVKVCSR